VEDFLGLVKTVNGSDNDIYEIARQLAEENGEDYEKWEKFAGGESVDISVIPISHVSQYFQYINAIVDAIKKAFPDTKDKKPEDLIRLAKEIAKGEKLELLDNNRACEIVDNWKRSKAPNEIPRQVPPERVVVTRDKPPERSNDSPPKDKFRSERPKDNPSGSDRDPDKARKDDSTKTLKH
jgi:hypothetical protein